jgi:hypothetical protein
MKNVTKPLFVTCLVAGLAFSAKAQTTSADATAKSTATVLTEISVSSDADIAFGNVMVGDQPTLDAGDFGSSTAVGATAALGKFTVIGTPTAHVEVTFPTTVTMTNADSDELDFTPSVYRTALTDATDGETEIFNEGTYTINSSSANAVAGEDHFFVGGILSKVGGGNIPVGFGGLFTGEFKLTVTYN